MIAELLEEKNVLINGIDISYKTLGQGMPFLILHGWGSRSEKWQEVGRIIAEKGFRVIIPDLPGFGKSQTPKTPWGIDDYCNFVDNFVKLAGLDKFYLSGHSFGGAVAAKYSIKSPQRIEKLFLVAARCIRKKTFKKQFITITSQAFKAFSFIPLYSLFRRAFYKFIIRRSDYPYTKGVMKET